MVTNLLNFFFPKRIARLSYVIRIHIVVLIVFWYMIDSLNHPPLNILFFSLIGFYTVRSVIIPRVDDCGLPRWVAWLLIVPGLAIFIGLGLTFIPTRVIFDPSAIDEQIDPSETPS